MRDVKDKKNVATGADFTRGNILVRRGGVNKIVFGKFEFLTALETSIQFASYITSYRVVNILLLSSNFLSTL